MSLQCLQMVGPGSMRRSLCPWAASGHGRTTDGRRVPKGSRVGVFKTPGAGAFVAGAWVKGALPAAEVIFHL